MAVRLAAGLLERSIAGTRQAAEVSTGGARPSLLPSGFSSAEPERQQIVRYPGDLVAPLHDDHRVSRLEDERRLSGSAFAKALHALDPWPQSAVEQDQRR